MGTGALILTENIDLFNFSSNHILLHCELKNTVARRKKVDACLGIPWMRETFIARFAVFVKLK